MKVFISHSSKDKWAARRISQDIEAIGVQTFLDEKDIKTGESLDKSIRKQLNDCDEFVILLSPASIRSEWVLIELGGAMALGKHIVPILLYVGANDIPQAINLKLARDINDVQTYYDELSVKLGATVSKKKVIRKKVAKKKATVLLKVGDKVKIVASPPGDEYRDTGLDTYWVDDMNSYLGRSAKVTHVQTPQKGDYRLDIDNEKFIWVSAWLVTER